MSEQILHPLCCSCCDRLAAAERVVDAARFLPLPYFNRRDCRYCSFPLQDQDTHQHYDNCDWIKVRAAISGYEKAYSSEVSQGHEGVRAAGSTAGTRPAAASSDLNVADTSNGRIQGLTANGTTDLNSGGSK